MTGLVVVEDVAPLLLDKRLGGMSHPRGGELPSPPPSPGRGRWRPPSGNG